YKENMYAPMEMDNQEFYMKPMNCPFHILIYKTKRRSYRELPLRWAELGTVYRYERSGVLHGLLRVRGFTQDDAHLFCRPDNMPERFDMTYIGEDGKEHRPYMIHRALLGSMERFFGCLIEHWGGAFPLWLAPVQATIIPISDVKHLDYAQRVAEQLKAAGLRA